jgi:hypothetical protein
MTRRNRTALAVLAAANYACCGFFEADPMDVTAVCKSISDTSFAAMKRTERRTDLSGRGRMRRLLLGVVTAALIPVASHGGILSEADFKKVETMKPMFQALIVDLAQTSKRTDISSNDAECVATAMRELLQISDELSSYEYLITIEREITDSGDNSQVKGVITFAIDKTNTILSEERKRLAQLSDRCSRFPLGFGKTQLAIQFIDTTTGILKSIQTTL